MTDTQHITEQDQLSDNGATLVAIISLGAVLAIVGLLYVLAQIFRTDTVSTANQDQSPEAIVERLKPVAGFQMGATSTGPKTGQQVYEALCQACHGAGVAGAPKVGDSAAWGARIGQGYATLLKHAVEGFAGKTGNMPAKGGDTSLSDIDVGRAIVFMANKSGGSLAEPAAPAADKDAKAGDKAAAPAADTAKKP